MEYTLMVYSPNEKGMILWKFHERFFEVVVVMLKDKKVQYQR